MGWIEETDNGRRINHDHQLADPDGTLVVPANGIDWWLAHGAVGAPLRTACTCGWISSAPGPALPALPPAAQPPTTERPVRVWTSDDPVAALLPWHFVRDFDPGPAVRTWEEYQVRTWQTHIADTLAGTNADDPQVHARRRVAALLDDVEEHPTIALGNLRQVTDAVEEAAVLAIDAARRQGHNWETIAQMLGVGTETARKKHSGHQPGDAGHR